MKLTDNAKILLETRYFQPNETWNKLVKRVARAIARAEKTDALKKKWEAKFISVIETGEFVPATPFLMNANISDHYFSCYVLPIEDSLESIYSTVAEAAKIFQVAGGVGYDFSNLRPKGCSTTKNPLGHSSGPVSFMNVYNASCLELTQGGSRKGAQMGVLRIDHPDIEEFVDVKQDLTKLTQFNVSATVTDHFMELVKTDGKLQLTFPSHPQMDHIINAKDLWKKIIHNAWKTGDPGLIFIDEINRRDNIGGITCTNPCAEQGLTPYGCCDLGSIDLSKLITKQGTFDYNRLEEITAIATRFLDNAIDVNNYTLSNTKETQLNERRIGLGPMGVADALIELGLPYDSIEGRHWCEQVAQQLNATSKRVSEELAEEKGAFPLQPVSKLKDDKPIRNSMRTTSAPTGCLVGSTRIHTKIGSPQISDLQFSENPKQFLDHPEPFEVSTDVGVSQSNKTYFNGMAETIKVTTQKGYSIEATTEHRVRVINSKGYTWKHMKDLKLGDQICLARGTAYDFNRDYVKLIPEEKSHFNTHKITWPTILTEDTAYFLGMFIGDGNFTSEGIRIAFNLTEKDEISRVDDLIFTVFGRRFTCAETPNGNGICYNFNSRQLKKWLQQFGLINTEHKLQIPQQIWDSPASVKGAFLRGLYDADGSISPRSRIIELSSHDSIFIKDIQRLLLDLGIVSNFNSWVRDKSCFKPGSKMCKLFISYQEDLIAYSNIVGFSHINKNTKLPKVLSSYQSSPRKRDKQFFDLPKELTSNRIHYESIVLLESSEAYTYDIEVPENHTYIADGFVSHNSISIIAGCSGGIEPIFALAFTRKHDLKDHEELLEINKAFQRVAIERGFYSESLMTKIINNNGSCQGLKEVPEDVQKIFKVSADLYPEDHVEMLATWQKYIQSGVSKTINMAANATEEDVERVYWQAYESGCKGITVFRDGCRGGVQVLNTGTTNKKDRPDVVSGQTMRVNTSLGKMFITVNSTKNGGDIDKPFEVFVTLSKGGTNAAADAEAVGRLTSLLLRSRVEVQEIVKQLKGIGSGEVAFNPGRVVSSIPDAVAYVLEKMFLNEDEKVEHPDTNERPKYFPSGSSLTVCKDCG